MNSYKGIAGRSKSGTQNKLEEGPLVADERGAILENMEEPNEGGPGETT